MKSLNYTLAFFVFSLLLVTEAWSQTIPLVPERGGHAASLLNSGQVLLTGGVNETATLKSALLYNHAKNTLTPTGDMVSARADQTSTLLPNGRVLITGGDENSTIFQSAELYDPATGMFTLTFQPMTTARSSHTATLLPDGKVLVVGANAADLYDPLFQTFTRTTGTPISRKNHSAVLLPDGKVLVAGGYVGTIASQSAEIYDPATQLFTVLPNKMQVPRANFTATVMPDGKVLITGGFSGTSPHAETEIYDPLTQTFTIDTPMLQHRSSHRAILQGDGRVVIIGGVTLESGFLAANEVYDPSTHVFSSYACLLDNRGGHTATLLQDGNIFVAGGASGNSTLKTAEVLDPVTHQFTAVGNLQVARNQHRANLLGDGKVLLSAGSIDADNLNSSELFDPATNTFSLSGSLHVARKSHTATTLADGRVLVTGGKAGEDGYLRSAEIYDPATQLFTEILPLRSLRALHTATLLNDGQVLVAGGVQTGGVSTATAELFDPVTQTFDLTGSLTLQRKRHRASLLDDGTVLVMGGDTLPNAQGGSDRETETAEVFNPATATFSEVGSMSLARAEHESTLLDDGTVLVTGGTVEALPGDLYNPSLASFSTVGSMIQARGRHVSLRLTNPAWGSLTGHVLAIGGAAIGGPVFGGGQQAQNSVEIYDPATGLFSFFGTMTEARQNQTATELNDGRILIAGGVGRPFISGTAEVLAGPSPSPTPTPAATPSKPLNISTRVDTLTGDNVLIGGFIITGGTSPKNVLIRAVGPSLAFAIPGALGNPILEVHLPDGTIVINDDWESDQKVAIEATGLAPTNALESAILTTLPPYDPSAPGSGAYTAIVKGVNGTTGVALVEIYDLDQPSSDSVLANISTRGLVQTDDGAMIGGFIIGPGVNNGQFLIKAIGPSLAAAGIPNPLADPTLNLYDSQGTSVGTNDEWQSDQKAAIETTGLAPKDAHESAILADLLPGAYTAIVLGKDSTSGVGLVEVYYYSP